MAEDPTEEMPVMMKRLRVVGTELFSILKVNKG